MSKPRPVSVNAEQENRPKAREHKSRWRLVSPSSLGASCSVSSED